MATDREFIRMQGELEELRRFAQEAVDAEEKNGTLSPEMRALRTYLRILDEREKPELDRIKAILERS